MILTAEAHLAKTDAVLAATVVLTMGSLARVYLWAGPDRPPLGWSLTFWIGLGLGILVKGPIAPMVALLTIVSLVAIDRRAKWLMGLRPLIGVPLCLAIVLPWFVAILSVAGAAFLKQSVGTDLLGKVATGQESPRGAAGHPFRRLLADFLARCRLGAACRPLGVDASRRGSGQVLSRVDRSFLDRLRGRRHQAAALYAADLPGDRCPARRRRRRSTVSLLGARGPAWWRSPPR